MVEMVFDARTDREELSLGATDCWGGNLGELLQLPALLAGAFRRRVHEHRPTRQRKIQKWVDIGDGDPGPAGARCCRSEW